MLSMLRLVRRLLMGLGSRFEASEDRISENTTLAGMVERVDRWYLDKMRTTRLV